MFDFLFNYPLAAFARGELVLLSSQPRWLLVLLIVMSAAALAVLMRMRAMLADIKVEARLKRLATS